MELSSIAPVVPEWFAIQLREFDPSLEVAWHPAHGVWSIWHNSDRGKDHVMNVQEPDGTFRELDERVFKTLRANRWLVEHPEELIKMMLDDPQIRSNKVDEFEKDELKHFSRDASLKKRYADIVDKARSVPMGEWDKFYSKLEALARNSRQDFEGGNMLGPKFQG